MENNRDKSLAPLVRISSLAPSTESLRMPVDQDDNLLKTPKIDRKFQGRESVISSQISLYIKKKKPKIPDGGWGWWIVIAAFFINMVSDGVSLTFGVLYVEFLNEFRASNSATSWIGSLFMAVPLLAGPIMSALVDRYGCRSMTIVGAIISTIGFVISSYAKSLVVMYITFGVIGGLGLGLCFVTAVVSIAFWFEKKRTIALGLGACGTGFGTLVFSPLSAYLVSEFNWRGTLLIMAGCFLNLCVCGALMRDPDWIKEQDDKDSDTSSDTSSSMDIEEIRENLMSGEREEYALEDLETKMDLTRRKRFKSVVYLPTFIKRDETVPLEVLEKLSTNKNIYNVILENYPTLLVSKSSSEKDFNNLSANQSHVPVTFSMKLKKVNKPPSPNLNRQISNDPKPSKTQNTDKKQHFLRDNSFNKQKLTTTHHYLKNLYVRQNSAMHHGAMLNTNRYKMKTSSCPNMYRNSILDLFREKDETWYEEVLEIIKDMMQPSLFLELHFLLINLSTILLFTWFIVPYFYLVDHMKKNNYTDTEASFVISVIGITNTIGMVVLGWAGDRPWMNVQKTYALCLILCGVFCTAMLVFTYSYIMIIINAALFGLFFASTFSFTPAILADLVPIDNFTMAYGLILLSQGIGNLLGPPIAGLLYDLTNSWDQSFYQAGFWIIISGILAGIIPYTKNRKLLGKGPVIKDAEDDNNDKV